MSERKALLLGRVKELDRDLLDLRSELRKARQDIEALDNAMIVLDPEYDTTAITAKTTYFRQFKRGELQQLCLEALKNADGLLTHLDIAESVARDSVNPAVPETILGKVRIALYGLRRRGMVEGVKWPGNRIGWRIKPLPVKGTEKAGPGKLKLVERR